MDCSFCGRQMEKGEISITGVGGTIYWVPENYMEKHPFKTCQIPHTIKKSGGVIIDCIRTSVRVPMPPM